MKNEWIDRLAKFSHENPGVLDSVTRKCPREYGLSDYCHNIEIEMHFLPDDYIVCGRCWERALKEYREKDENKCIKQ